MEQCEPSEFYKDRQPKSSISIIGEVIRNNDDGIAVWCRLLLASRLCWVAWRRLRKVKLQAAAATHLSS